MKKFKHKNVEKSASLWLHTVRDPFLLVPPWQISALATLNVNSKILQQTISEHDDNEDDDSGRS